MTNFTPCEQSTGMADIDTVGTLIDKLGGTGQTAEIFGVLPSAVSNWRRLNRFPARLHYRIAKEAEARDIALSATLFESPPDGLTNSHPATLPAAE